METMKPIEPMVPMSPGAIERLRNNNIIQAWLVLVLTLCFGTALAGVQLMLGPQIEENKINETLEKVPELVLGKDLAQQMAAQGKTLNIQPHVILVDKNGRTTAYNVFEARDTEKRVGWVVKTGGQGYADRIELLMGLTPEIDSISGIFVLEQKETPGLGNKIVTDEWRKQFIGKDATVQPLSVVKDGANTADEIDAITGATISSRSVTQIINTALADLKGPLAAKTIEVK